MRNVFSIWPEGKFQLRFLQFRFDFMATFKWDIFEVRAELPSHFEYPLPTVYCYSLAGNTQESVSFKCQLNASSRAHLFIQTYLFFVYMCEHNPYAYV